MKVCNKYSFFCWQCDGNLGICKYTSNWCKNNRGWFPSKNKWLKCGKLLRLRLWLKYNVKYKVKRIYRDIWLYFKVS